MTYSTYYNLFSHGELSLAEAQGIAVGLLCTEITSRAERWLTELSPYQKQASGEQKELLLALFHETQANLNDENYGFNLLLPEEESTLAERVIALREWCQGFLFGLGTQTQTQQWNNTVREIIRDLGELTKLSISADDEEADFIELFEYVRSAVLLLRTELNT